MLWGGGRHPDFFRSPVRWLFGRDLLVHMRSIAVYSAFGAELDHRDWMHAEPIDLRTQACEEGGFWFDYLADSGDGQLAMYDLACLLLGDLFLDDATPGAAVSLQAGAVRLPRGSFVFMGGDTAYHVADDATLEERVCTPFDWALAERRLGAAARNTETEPRDRFVFGVPGNHDYYDSLIGFNRLLRAPDNPRLAIADWQRRQSASYVALRLPFDYWFLGLDSQHGKLDRRQREFASELLAKHGAKRLIIATPEPATAFDAPQPEAARPFSALGLSRPFCDGKLPDPEAIQLDLAGDVHHYARYADATASNYAYVVSGGGGAFLHPTETSHGDRSAARYYPDRSVSSREITRRLLCPWRIFRGGGVLLLGGLCATLLYFGAVLGPGMHELFTRELIPLLAGSSAAAELAGFHIESPVVNDVGRTVTAEANARDWRMHLLWSEWLALGLLATVLGAGFATRKRLFQPASDPDVAARSVVLPQRYLFLVSLAVLAVGSMALMYYQRSSLPYVALLSPLLANLLSMLYLLPLPLSVLWAIGYMGTLPKQAKLRRLRPADSLPRWTAFIFGAATAVLGLLAYGVNSVAAFAADVGATLAALTLGVGPVVAGWLQGSGRSLARRVGYAALGAWFGALQLVLPLVLALHGTWLSATASLVCALVCSLIALPLSGSRSRLLLLWLAAGSGALACAFVLGSLSPVRFTRFAVAFLAGGVFSCVWFGWYLAVSLAFHAHNNEAGGAARLDAFRHFIRFKLERDRLTGYVIGFDWPCRDLSALRVKLIERFELTPLAARERTDPDA
ncbi:MAG TPA: metallophosphoesterase [Polyangiales bacterium]|nr:metallophosphoesterase [Polyangiales bacterium]